MAVGGLKNIGVAGWFFSENVSDFKVTLDETVKHSGTRSALVESTVNDFKSFATLSQIFLPKDYLGKRLRMSAWVKTELTMGSAQLWVRVDDANSNLLASQRPGCFDNMSDRPIKGKSDWTCYELVVDVGQSTTALAFGLMHCGLGKIWLDDVAFEEVSLDTPLTGRFKNVVARKIGPVNLNFESSL